MVDVMNAVVFGRERVSDIWKEIEPLFNKHHIEIDGPGYLKLAPDFDNYRKADEAGNLRLWTARKEGVLVGYLVHLVANHHNYKSFQAWEDVMFIDKNHRGFGLSFIKWCDDQLKKEGVEMVTQNVSVNFDFSPILERIGYKQTYKVYSRRL